MCVYVSVCVCVLTMQEGSHAQLILQTEPSAAWGDMHSTVEKFVL